MKTLLYPKIIIVVSVFVMAFGIFKLLQNESVFKSTLGKIAITYKNTAEPGENIKTGTIIKTDFPYTTLEEANFINWDVVFFKYMSENTYGKVDVWPEIGTYAFAPLFPFIWRISHLPAPFISILNYLLFAISIIILSSLFLSSRDFSKTDHLLLFLLALTLPTVFSYYIPYSEATFLFTMTIALWGLAKNKYWIFFVGMVAFVLSRPSFLIFTATLILTDLYFLIVNRNFKVFFKDLILKLQPVAIGIMITFFLHYLYSGNFFKMFEVHNLFWKRSFTFPRTITDWSTEGYGMNIFSILFVVLPSCLFLITYLAKYLKTEQKTPVTLFSENTRRDYLFILSIVFFFGNFVFVMITQGGNLNGIHRYILVSPLFYVFFFILADKLKSIKFNFVPISFITLVFIGFLLLIHGPYQHRISFLDAGYFLLCLTMVYYLYFNKIHRVVKIALLPLLVFGNTVWLTYLFNHFLNNAFIIP